MSESIQFTRIVNDVNGNPRYVCHFLTMAPTYEAAIKLANSIGGRKYHTKGYGGGLVFQSYNVDQLVNHINRVAGKAYTTHTITR
jgi:hypothetical protein